MSPMQRKSGALLILMVIISSWALSCVKALRFNVPTSGTKCVSEDIQANVLVLADYWLVKDESTHDPRTISVKVTSPYGNPLYHTENVSSGQFGFMTHEYGAHIACFWVHNSTQGTIASVDLDWKIGVAAKDWSEIARKEKIEGVELELRKLEGAVGDIHQNLLWLKDRESEMREVSEVTNSRVAWFGIMSLTVCLVVSAWQLWHLKRFFEKKKLI